MNKVLALLALVVLGVAADMHPATVKKNFIKNFGQPLVRTRAERSIANYCPNAYTCSNNGGICGSIITSATTFSEYNCNGQSYCLYSQSSNYNNGTCTAQLATGAPCADNVYTNDGDECKATDICQAGTCQTVTYTKTSGQACTDLNQCAAGLDCNNAVCVALPTTGAACTSSVGCAGPSDCLNQKCVGYGTVDVGGTCGDNNDNSILYCKAGLYCFYNGSDFTQTCAKPPTGTGAACNYTSDCTNNNYCSCTSAGASTCQAPATLSSSSLNSIINTLNCYVTNKCTAINSCSCSLSDQCAAQQAALGYFLGIPGGSAPACFAGGPCEYSSSSATGLVAATSILVSAVLFLLM